MAMRLAACLAFACELAACGVRPDYFVVNEANREIRLLRDERTQWADARLLQHGQMARLSVHPAFGIRIGDCTYRYPGLVAPRFTGAAADQARFEFRVQPDFAVRVFERNGGVYDEVSARGSPVTPQVDCRTKG